MKMISSPGTYKNPIEGKAIQIFIGIVLEGHNASDTKVAYAKVVHYSTIVGYDASRPGIVNAISIASEAKARMDHIRSLGKRSLGIRN